jgi:hypothetical protein
MMIDDDAMRCSNAINDKNVAEHTVFGSQD